MLEWLVLFVDFQTGLAYERSAMLRCSDGHSFIHFVIFGSHIPYVLVYVVIHRNEERRAYDLII